MHEEPQTLPTTHPTEEIITKDDFAGEIAGEGVLEVMPDGYGFLRSADYNYLNSRTTSTFLLRRSSSSD